MNSTTSSIPVEILDGTGNPIPSRYASREQELAAEAERQRLELAEAARLLKHFMLRPYVLNGYWRCDECDSSAPFGETLTHKPHCQYVAGMTIIHKYGA